MEACIGVSRAVGRNEELCAFEECRVHRDELYLHRPLRKPALLFRSGRGLGSVRCVRYCLDP